MLKFGIYKNNELNLNLEDSPITNINLQRILDILNSNVLPDEELNFSITDLNGDVLNYKITNSNGFFITQNNQTLEYKNFSSFLLSKAFIKLDANTINTRVLSTNALEDLKSQIKLLSIDIDPALTNTKQNNEKQIEDLKLKIEGSLNDDQKDKYKRLQELNSRAEAIQEQISFYQNEKKIKEELNSQIKKFNTEKQNTMQMLESVELLIKSREDLVAKLNTYNNNTTSQEQINELKTKKVNYLNSKLFENKSAGNLNISEDEDDKKTNHLKFNLNVTIILTVLNLIITVIAFLYSYSINVLIIGTIFSVVLATLYIISRFFKDSLEDITPSQPDSKLTLKENTESVKPEHEDPNTQLFLNSAWANALKSELQLIDANIQKNLNGKSYEILKAEQAKIEESLILENKKLEDINSKSLTSDEYYKKRRENDILKIEKENLEFGLKVEPELTNQLNALTSSLKEIEAKIALATKIANNFPVFIVSNLKKEQISELKQDLFNQLVLVIAN